MSNDFKIKLYDEAYSHEWQTSKADRIRLKKALGFVESGGKVLDVGCFTGVIGKEIESLGNDVYGIEISLPAISKANSKGIKTIRSDMDNKLPVKSNTFDGVFAGEVIEHLFDVDTFLSEIHRVLRKNGYIVLTTPNLLSFWNRIRAIAGMPFIDFNKDKQHIRFFTKSTLKDLLKKHGFETEKILDTQLVLPIFSRFDIVFERSIFNLGENIILKARKI